MTYPHAEPTTWAAACHGHDRPDIWFPDKRTRPPQRPRHPPTGRGLEDPMSDAYYWHAEEAWRAANAPEAAGRSHRDRPGAGEDEPDRGEIAAAEHDDNGDDRP